METKLSTRIKKLMQHCPTCQGKGIYSVLFRDERGRFTPHVDLACQDCYDWNVALKGVIKLEKQVQRLNKLNKNK